MRCFFCILLRIDVTMGAYGSAEICELICIFMLPLIEQKYNSKYRDDVLSVFHNTSGPDLEKS